MLSRHKRMSTDDRQLIVSELDKWALGQLGSKLTWSMLEERFNFSRQSMQSKSDIKAAYSQAKESLAGGLVATKESIAEDNEKLQCEVSRLGKEVSRCKDQELKWMKRWQRIAFNIRQKGIQIQEIDKPTPEGAKIPNQRDTADIIRPFDKEIPSSGRI